LDNHAVSEGLASGALPSVRIWSSLADIEASYMEGMVIKKGMRVRRFSISHAQKFISIPGIDKHTHQN
jgi:hypothetical protein